MRRKTDNWAQLELRILVHRRIVQYNEHMHSDLYPTLILEPMDS